MSRIHALLGTGNAPKTVIQEGLRDLLEEDDVVALPWYGKPTDGLAAAYDYILDNDVQFLMYHNPDNKPPKAFTSAESGSTLEVNGVEKQILGAMANKGKVLILWDDNEAEELVNFVFDTVPESALVLELSNGLAPISLSLVPEKEEVTPAVTSYVEDDPTDDAPVAFTEDELNIMPVASLKRLAMETGNLPDGVSGKANYIKVILGTALPAQALPPKEDLPVHVTPKAAKPYPANKPTAGPLPSQNIGKPMPVTLGDSDLTLPAPTTPVVVGYEELRASLFDHAREPSRRETETINDLTSAAFQLGEHIISNVPAGRHRSLALKALEDVVSRSVKGIILG